MTWRGNLERPGLPDSPQFPLGTSRDFLARSTDTKTIMKTIRSLIHFTVLTLACVLLGCASDPLSNVTSTRSVAEVEPKVRANMPLAELLGFTKNTPVMTQGYTRLMLADGDLWIIEDRDGQGVVTVKDWRFDRR